MNHPPARAAAARTAAGAIGPARTKGYSAAIDHPDDVIRRNHYDKYASSNPIEQRLIGGFFDAFDTALRPLAPGSVLEVGAGEGEVNTRVRRMFPSASVLALDLPDAGTAEDWRQRGLLGLFGDIHRLPFPDAAFDVVLAIEVLEHVTYPEIALAEIERVCSHSVVLSVPREPVWRAANMARGNYWADLGNTPGHVNHWSARGFCDLVGRRFDVRWSARPFPWTMVRATRR